MITNITHKNTQTNKKHTKYYFLCVKFHIILKMNGIDIKIIRKELKKTQQEFADILGISKSLVQKWESGDRTPDEITQKSILKLSNAHRSGRSDVLIKNYDDEIEVFENKNGIKFYLYPDDSIQIEVLKVPYKAYASYVEAYTDELKLNREFSKVSFKVDKIGKGNYLAFESQNDSMNGGGIDDTPGGADLLGREVGRHLWKDGFRKTKYGMILLTKRAIYHKDITSYNQETGMLTLNSRNPENKDFEISINDVFQIFNVIKRTF